jgi:hypothetical protein
VMRDRMTNPALIRFEMVQLFIMIMWREFRYINA